MHVLLLLGVAFVMMVGCVHRPRPETFAAATFIVTGVDDQRLPPPMAEERLFTVQDRAEIDSLGAHFGAPVHGQSDREAATIFWNRLTTRLSLAAGLPPPALARSYALTHIAIFDSLFTAKDSRRGRLDKESVAAGAASGVLHHLFPVDSVTIRDAAASRLADIRRDDVRRGFFFGRSVGQLVVQYAESDGSGLRRIPQASRGPNTWIGNAGVLPSAGEWKTWITTSGAEFQPAEPFRYGSLDDLRDLEDVYRASLERTPTQIAVVRKWAEWPPPTLWNDELNRRLPASRRSELENARASAYLNAAMFDAFVACWKAKYTYWTARPYMRLRERVPMFTTVVTTPNFPSYTSGHSTISGAAAVVLAELFPEDASVFDAQAEEAALSRFWGGIHFRYDNDQGLAVGRKIGAKAVQRMRHTH